MTLINDITGNKYGKLQVISLYKKINKTKNNAYYWNIKCECGKKLILSTTQVKRTKNCGCSKNYNISQERFYKIWNSMKMRCKNLNDKNYGGRGITFCEEWNSFQEFLKDMYISYCKSCIKYGEKNTTLDRIDFNGNYCKENCRWATMKEQANNKRNNIKNRIILDIDGNKINFNDFCNKYNIKYCNFINMINKKYDIKDIIKSNGLESNIRLFIYKEIILNNINLFDNFLDNWKKVIFLIYGIEDNIFKTKAEVSRILKLTKSRIGQIEKSALNKLAKLLTNY